MWRNPGCRELWGTGWWGARLRVCSSTQDWVTADKDQKRMRLLRTAFLSTPHCGWCLTSSLNVLSIRRTSQVFARTPSQGAHWTFLLEAPCALGPFGTLGVLLQRRWEFSALFEERYFVLREARGPPLPKGLTRMSYWVCSGLYRAPLRWQTLELAERGRETPKALWDPRELGWSIFAKHCWSAVIVPGNSNGSSVGCVISHLVFNVRFQNTSQ